MLWQFAAGRWMSLDEGPLAAYCAHGRGPTTGARAKTCKRAPRRRSWLLLLTPLPPAVTCCVRAIDHHTLLSRTQKRAYGRVFRLDRWLAGHAHVP